MEFWTSTVAAPSRSAGFAREVEARGWDGMLVVDSQNLSGDPYVCLALAATASETLGRTGDVRHKPSHAARGGNGQLSLVRPEAVPRPDGARYWPW